MSSPQTTPQGLNASAPPFTPTSGGGGGRPPMNNTGGPGNNYQGPGQRQYHPGYNNNNNGAYNSHHAGAPGGGRGGGRGGYNGNGRGGGYRNNHHFMQPQQNMMMGPTPPFPDGPGAPNTPYYGGPPPMGNAPMMHQQQMGGGGGNNHMGNNRNNNNMGPMNAPMDPSLTMPPQQMMGPPLPPMQGMPPHVAGPPPQQGMPMPPYQSSPQPQQMPQQYQQMPGNNNAAPPMQRPMQPTPSPAPPQQTPPPPVARATPPAPRKPEIILVCGTKKSSKTAFATSIGKAKGYPVVSLDPKVGQTASEQADNGSDKVDDGEVVVKSIAQLLDKIKKALEAPKLGGLVIDDAICQSRFDIYYINCVIKNKGYDISAIVAVTPLLSSSIQNGVAHGPDERALHPDSYELAYLLGKLGDYPRIMTPEHDYTEESVQQEIDTVIEQLMTCEPRPIAIPRLDFFRHCTLIDDYDLRSRIIDTEATEVGVEGEFGIPFVEPNYLLEYTDFTRNAMLFREYKVVPYLWGDKVSIIDYDGMLYLHLPCYGLVFLMDPAPDDFARCVASLRTTMPPNHGRHVLLSLEAVVEGNTIYITDMMLLGTDYGKERTLRRRINLLKDAFSELSGTGDIRLVEFYNVRDVAKCRDDQNVVSRGCIFVNPDVMHPGTYEVRNYLFPWPEEKTVEVQLWQGTVMVEDVSWVFDATVADNGYENDRMALEWKVVIPEKDVYSDDSVVNDGNIVRCVLEPICSELLAYLGGNASESGKGSKKNSPKAQYQLRFLRRCEWKSVPVAAVYVPAMLEPTEWGKNKFIKCCSTIEYEEPDDEDK